MRAVPETAPVLSEGAAPLRIVRIAGFGAPVTGGLRAALRELGAGYRAAGHDPVLVLPGSYASDERTVQGRVVTLPAPPLPGTGGHRVLTGRHRLARLLEDLAPDRLEVCDRAAPQWTGTWARRAGIPSVAVAYGSVAGRSAPEDCRTPLPCAWRTRSTGAPPAPSSGSSARAGRRRRSSPGSVRAASSARRWAST